MNIVEPILFQCKLNPQTTAICVPGSPVGPVTYDALENFIHNAARTALKSGVVPGNVIPNFKSSYLDGEIPQRIIWRDCYSNVRILEFASSFSVNL
jgi:hypothetical protein